jgi:60 kDa SS-A/Ro ribonucleoprotein
MESGTIAGIPGLTPRVGVGALALITAAVEPQHAMVAFTSGAPGEWAYGAGRSMHSGMGYRSAVTPLSISPRQRLDDVCQMMKRMPMGGTDCALPMLYAAEKKIPVDVFCVMTDNETWANPEIQPCQALNLYRQQMGIPSKLIVVGMTATEFSIADKSDMNQLDVVGFDTAAPQVMADFARD